MRAALLALAACSQRAPIATCAQNLEGAYSTAEGRWMLLDHGSTLEAYPLFDDAAPAGDLVIAPRVIELVRGGNGASGLLHRRYMRRGDACEARALVQLESCAGDTLELGIGEVAPPTSLTPCAWPPSAPLHLERWRRD